MKVIKNTYLRRAAAKAGIEGLDDTFVGPTAVIYTDNADDGPFPLQCPPIPPSTRSSTSSPTQCPQCPPRTSWAKLL